MYMCLHMMYMYLKGSVTMEKEMALELAHCMLELARELLELGPQTKALYSSAVVRTQRSQERPRSRSILQKHKEDFELSALSAVMEGVY